ncbi:hypothetical protein AAVH_21999 [Aphelenchoides avenae]|nr:hypothetical protein AAVH_21999 [Aphelenchus avenae]
MPGWKGWAGREELHERIVNDTVDALSKNMSRYVFNALAHLPDDRSDRQCRQFLQDNVVKVEHPNLNFFVLYANASSKNNSDEAWDKLTDKKDAVLDHVFAKNSNDLCGRFDAAINDNKVNRENFRGGFAAVKCGYEFVWYELGYTYFHAAYSSTDYKWQKKGSAYDANCGQIFFFP